MKKYKLQTKKNEVNGIPLPKKNDATVLEPHLFLASFILSLLGSGIISSQDHEPRYSIRKTFYNHGR